MQIKKIFNVALLISFLSLVVYVYYKAEEKVQLSALTIENIEALTDNEASGSSGSKTKREVCYKDISFEKEESRVANTWYCGDCSEVPYTTRSNQLICKRKL